MTIDNARRNLESKRRDLSRSGDKRTQAQKKVAVAARKESSAQRALNKAKTESSVKSKMRSLQAASKQLVAAQKALSLADSDYAKKEKAVIEAQKKVAKEEEACRKKELKEAQAAAKRNNEQHIKHNRELARQNSEIDNLGRRVLALENQPDSITVLMLSSGPDDQDKLRQDKEAREIREAISKSKHRDAVAFEDRWAVRTEDLFQAINETEPTIIHFSGHGAESGELVMEDDMGLTKLVTPEAIAQVLSTVSNQVRLLVFNACFSVDQAQAATKSIEAAIGMSKSISDRAAITFAVRLYSAIGFGLSLEKAYEQACASLMFDNADEVETPILFTCDGVDPSDLYYVNCFEQL